MKLKLTVLSDPRISQALLAAACAAAMPSLALASCGSAFCSVNTNWTTESAMTEPGSSFDLRYEYINQTQPRAGSDKVAVGQIPHEHDEVSTANRNLLATYSHTFNSTWGLSIIAPLVDRNHFHLHNDDDGGKTPERWSFTELGDMRMVARYQLPFLGDPTNPSTAGVTFGLKLPTGRTKIANADGDVAERTLQPGTGTTDAIIGAYYHQKLPQWNASWFVQAQVQQALNSHDDFKPGTQFGIDAGVRYGVSDKLGALVQINALVKRRDSGAQAEPEDSGGRYLSISPGLSYAITDKIQVYGFIQKPVYQHVNGVQLTADKSLVLGLSSRF
jgi:hypothetical protein